MSWNASDFLPKAVGFVVAATLAWCAVLIALAVRHTKRMNRRDADDVQPQPAPISADISPWQALPGQVLELSDTGFSIRHRPDDPMSDYFMYSPEGNFMCAVPAGNLEGLMKFAERCAQERQLFAAVKPLPAIKPSKNHDH